MSLAKASLWTAASTVVKIAAGLLVVKMLAVSFGPSGVGLAGNYRQLITVLSVLAGAGIFNGVTKYVAEYHHDLQQLRAVTGTASAIVLVFSTLLAIVFILFARSFSIGLFGHADYQDVLRVVAFLQLGIGWANLALAIVKGFRDARGNALALIVGSLTGVVAWFVCFSLGGYSGALVGMAMVPALVVIPAVGVLARREHLPMRFLRPCWDSVIAHNLSKFTLMALMTTITLPVAWMMMRNLLAKDCGWEQVGLWQGVTTISDAYLQFITASFSVYLLPTLSRMSNKKAISREILRVLGFVLPVVAVVSVLVWLLRDLVILLLFSGQFTAMRDLFIWQLTGDVFKVGAYVFGYLVIAKASLRFYAVTEVTQFILLTLFARWLIPLHGAAGAVQAYMAAYMVYFTLCAGSFYFYRRQA